VWEIALFGLKLGLDLEMRAAHPHQKFQGVPPPPGLFLTVKGCYTNSTTVEKMHLLISVLSAYNLKALIVSSTDEKFLFPF